MKYLLRNVIEQPYGVRELVIEYRPTTFIEKLFWNSRKTNLRNIRVVYQETFLTPGSYKLLCFDEQNKSLDYNNERSILRFISKIPFEPSTLKFVITDKWGTG